jgi:hypothetical protein
MELPMPIKAPSIIYFLAFFTTNLLLAYCPTVPIMERKAIHLVSDEELIAWSLPGYNKIFHRDKFSHYPGQVSRTT